MDAVSAMSLAYCYNELKCDVAVMLIRLLSQWIINTPVI